MGIRIQCLTFLDAPEHETGPLVFRHLSSGFLFLWTDVLSSCLPSLFQCLKQNSHEDMPSPNRCADKERPQTKTCFNWSEFDKTGANSAQKSSFQKQIVESVCGCSETCSFEQRDQTGATTAEQFFVSSEMTLVLLLYHLVHYISTGCDKRWRQATARVGFVYWFKRHPPPDPQHFPHVWKFFGSICDFSSQISFHQFLVKDDSEHYLVSFNFL